MIEDEKFTESLFEAPKIDEQERMVEAILFASSDPVTVKEIIGRLPHGCEPEKALNNLKEKYKIQSKGIAHVGAHLGQEIAEYTKHFSDAEIHLFEPQKNIFSDLKNKYCNLNNIYFYNVALGNQEGKVRLHNASNNGQSSSILEPKIKNTGLVEGNFYASQIAETILNMSKGIDTKIPIE